MNSVVTENLSASVFLLHRSLRPSFREATSEGTGPVQSPRRLAYISSTAIATRIDENVIWPEDTVSPESQTSARRKADASGPSGRDLGRQWEASIPALPNSLRGSTLRSPM